jgi:hypothetical protein
MALFRNEARFLREWIEYHLMLGVEHFYLGNNLSQDNWQEVLKPYLDAGIVEVEMLTHDPQNIEDFTYEVQCAFYNKTLNKIEDNTEWVMICDTDEFFVPLKADSIPETLKEFDTDVSAIAFSWRYFGTSGIERIPENKTLIEALTRSQNYQHGATKVICKPKDVFRSFVHTVEMKPGCKQVLGNGSPFPYAPHVPRFFSEGAKKRQMTRESWQFFHHNHQSTFCSENGLWYHYFHRDLEYLRNVKMKYAHRRDDVKTTIEAYVQSILDDEAKNYRDAQDTAIQRFVPTLRQRLGLKKQILENSS